MIEILPIADIAHAIQLAVAPVFLLTGIAGILGVLTTRLSRVTDRARVVESRLMSEVEAEISARLHKESKVLWHRVKLTNSAIRLCTSSALLVCMVIAVIFMGHYSVLDLSPVISLLFIGAMLVLIVGLLMFLREVHLATQTMKSGMQLTLEEE
jgi:uncharacterized membrane protein YGL010W